MGMPSDSPKSTRRRDGFAFDGIAEDDDQFGLGFQAGAQRFERFEFPALAGSHTGGRVLIFAHGPSGDGVNVRLMMTVVGANLERKERLLDRKIGANDQHGLLLIEIRGSSQLARLAAERIEQRGHIAGSMVIDIAGAQRFTRELLQVVIFFVGGVVRSDDAELPAARAHFLKLGGHGRQRMRPGLSSQLSVRRAPAAQWMRSG